MSTSPVLPQPAPADLQEVWRPDISQLVIEDDEPVDNIFSEKQQRLLTEPLYSSWSGPPPQKDGRPRPFTALANVGFFPQADNASTLVPDVALAVDVVVHEDLSQREHRTYFLWEFGKPPDVVIEIVSNRRGGELGRRFERYERVRVPYFVVYDPFGCLGDVRLQSFKLSGDHYVEMKIPHFEGLGLALAEWQGTYEHHADTWLRWFTLDGRIVPTGAERAEEERKRAEEERKRAAEERKRAESAEERVRRLEELLRERGIHPT